MGSHVKSCALEVFKNFFLKSSLAGAARRHVTDNITRPVVTFVQECLQSDSPNLQTLCVGKL